MEPQTHGSSLQQWKLWDRKTLLNELLIILLYAITLTILTYPLVFRIGEIIPFENPDTYTAMWQNWWLQTGLTQGINLQYSNYLFHPSGLDVTLIPQRWTSYPLWAFYESLAGDVVAYNLTVLTQTLIRAYAMFRFILLLVPHRPSAWVGGAFFAFVPRMLVTGIQQPNTGAVEFIPIFMIFFVLALRQIYENPQVTRHIIVMMILASLAFSANVYMNYKIGVFAMLLGGFYIAWRLIADRLWQYRNFWVGSIIFSVLSVALCLPILIPTLASGEIGSAIDQFTPSAGVDLMAFVQADRQHPIVYNYFFASLDGNDLSQKLPWAFAQIGFISIALTLIGVGIVIRKYPRQRLWIIVLFLGFWLSLGTVLRINGQQYDDIPMLMSALQYNPLFRALRQPHRFQIIMNFAMSIFIAYTIYSYLHRVSRLIGIVTIVGVTTLMFFETSVFPIPHRTAQVSEVYDYVTERHDGPIIAMPMGRQPSKYKMYMQMHHEQPIAEGMIARMPTDAYDTFNFYLLLRDMSMMNEITQISDELFQNWDTEIQSLLDAGFRYVVVHRLEDTGQWPVYTHLYQEFMFFMEIEPDFEAETAVVYDLQKLIGNPPMGDAIELERIALEETEN